MSSRVSADEARVVDSGRVVLSVGPQDVDSAAAVTKDLGVHNKAVKLLQRHARMYPPALRTLLSRPVDEERSAFLRGKADLLEAVADAAASVTGRKAFLPEDATVEGVTVKGDDAEGRIFAILFRTADSGRSARGAINYGAVPAVERAFQDRDLVPYNETSPSVPPDDSALEDVKAEVAEQVEALQRDFERQLAALAAENAALKEAAEVLEEPFEDYGDLNAEDAAKRVTDGGYLEFGRKGLEQIREYEEAQDRPRVTIVRAVEAQLEALDAAEAEADSGEGD